MKPDLGQIRSVLARGSFQGSEKPSKTVSARATHGTFLDGGTVGTDVASVGTVTTDGGLDESVLFEGRPSKGSAGGRKPLPSNLTPGSAEEKAILTQIFRMAEEILVYCQLVDSSKIRTEAETLRLRETVEKLETLCDAANAREREHLDKLEYYREVFAEIDKQYYRLKDRAKLLIKQCQDDRDSKQALAQQASMQVKTLENEVYSSVSLINGHRAELEKLRVATKGMTEREIRDLQVKVRRLTEQNAQLTLEASRMHQETEELQLKLQRLSDSNGDPDSNSKRAVINSIYGASGGGGGVDGGGKAMDTSSVVAAARMRLEDLEGIYEQLLEERTQQGSRLQKTLADERKELHLYREEAMKLLSQIDRSGNADDKL